MNQQKKMQEQINNLLSNTAVNLFQNGAIPILTLGMDVNNKVFISYDDIWTPEKIIELLHMVVHEMEKQKETKIITPAKIIGL